MKEIDKDLRFIAILCIFSVAFVFGYLASPAKTEVIKERFFERPAIVYEVCEENELITLETKDGNLWGIEAVTEDFAVGQECTVVFNEQDEIVDLF